MPYTLTMFLLWALAAAVVGAAVGWALRSVTARRELLRQRASGGDPRELERLRRQLGEVEAERDGLREELQHVADRPTVSGEGARQDATTGTTATTVAATPADVVAGTRADSAPVERVVDPVAADDVEAGAGDADPARHDVGPGAGDADPVRRDGDAAAVGARPDPADLDLERAGEVLGRTVRLDDLTAVEGIGPKIAELCGGIGVTTWRALADTPVDDLASMLDAAGSRYAMHRPDHWPRQAALLAEGRWEELRDLLASLGRRG